MFPKPKPVLVPNTYAFESEPMVKATGFREYDARWLFGKEINLMGVQALGMGLGALIAELGVKQEVVTGHDFRGYSASIKYALVSGLQAAGCRVHDIGLAMTPMAYFAQFELDVPCVAMVTASHNDNGWTGVKMGANRPLTFGPQEMNRLKEIVLEAQFNLVGGGSYVFVEDFPELYIADVTKRPRIKRKLKVVAACGNGTAGAFAPRVLEAIGCVPNTEWLEGNGLDLSDGVLCDNLMRVEGRPDVVACGDIARFPNLLFDDVPRRVEHWTMVTDTAKRAGASLGRYLTGQEADAAPFAPIPSFWSDQYELRLQSFGALGLGTDEVRVLEGDLDADEFAVGYYRGGKLVGVLLIGMTNRYQHYRKLITG